MDTSVVIAGAAAFRGAPLRPETKSGKLLLRWIEEGHFHWLYSEEILDEYKEILKRFNVRPWVIGQPNPGGRCFSSCSEEWQRFARSW